MAGVGWRVPSCWLAMPLAPRLLFDAHLARCASPSWSRRRVVLLGDAGYCGSPLAGLGTSLALVGAYVLAGELAARADDRRRRSRPTRRRCGTTSTRAPELPPGGVDAVRPAERD